MFTYLINVNAIWCVFDLIGWNHIYLRIRDIIKI